MGYEHVTSPDVRSRIKKPGLHPFDVSPGSLIRHISVFYFSSDVLGETLLNTSATSEIVR